MLLNKSKMQDNISSTCVIESCRLYMYRLSLEGHISSVQFSRSVTSNLVTPWTAARQAFLSITNYQSLLKLMSIELVMSSNLLILCHPFSFCLQFFPASGSFPMSQLFISPTAAAAGKSFQSCLTLWPQRRQPTRLPGPWDSPGKNTGVACHFLLHISPTGLSKLFLEIVRSPVS